MFHLSLLCLYSLFQNVVQLFIRAHKKTEEKERQANIWKAQVLEERRKKCQLMDRLALVISGNFGGRVKTKKSWERGSRFQMPMPFLFPCRCAFSSYLIQYPFLSIFPFLPRPLSSSSSSSSHGSMDFLHTNIHRVAGAAMTSNFRCLMPCHRLRRSSGATPVSLTYALLFLFKAFQPP